MRDQGQSATEAPEHVGEAKRPGLRQGKAAKKDKERKAGRGAKESQKRERRGQRTWKAERKNEAEWMRLKGAEDGAKQ